MAFFSPCARDIEIGFKRKGNFELSLKGGEQELIDEEKKRV